MITVCPPNVAYKTTTVYCATLPFPITQIFRQLIPLKADGSPKPDRSQAKWPRISRNNFIELCEELAVEDEKVFEHLFTALGLPSTGPIPTAP